MAMFSSNSDSFNRGRAYVALLHCYALVVSVYCLTSRSSNAAGDIIDSKFKFLPEAAPPPLKKPLKKTTTRRRVLSNINKDITTGTRTSIGTNTNNAFSFGPSTTHIKTVTNNNGIFPLLRELNCGHANLEVPRLLTQRPGLGRLVIDVGLGNDALETKAAIDNGLNVIAFELLPGNIATLKHRHGRDENFIFLTLEGDAKSGWRWPTGAGPPPKLGSDGRGIAYIVHAGLGPENSEADLNAEGASLVNGIGQEQTGKTVSVPVASLDAILPQWAIDQGIFFWKIDTQGYELQILKGATKLIQDNQFRYIQYEFSPWIMKRNNLGDIGELAALLPSFGAVCFDTMVTGSHNPLPHPVMPISAYAKHLEGNPTEMHPQNAFGPWDDITCYFPGNTIETTSVW
jgi:hypothetical protein